MNPICKNCGGVTLRWGWYQSQHEPVEYWYCLACDREGREPVIQIHPTRGGISGASGLSVEKERTKDVSEVR